MIGTSRMITQAPSMNLNRMKMISTTNERNAPKPLTKIPFAPAGFLVREVVLGHPRLRERERREHADRVERDQALDLRAGRDDEDHRSAGQEEDPVREHQPVPALGQLLGHEVVAGVERREPGKSANDVFAASTRMSIVPACSA